jgi:hypothetical protein
MKHWAQSMLLGIPVGPSDQDTHYVGSQIGLVAR